MLLRIRKRKAPKLPNRSSYSLQISLTTLPKKALPSIEKTARSSTWNGPSTRSFKNRIICNNPSTRIANFTLSSDYSSSSSSKTASFVWFDELLDNPDSAVVLTSPAAPAFALASEVVKTAFLPSTDL